MTKFDMGAAWDDSMTLLRSHSALTGTIAAVFFFLPTLALSWFGPAPIEPASGASLEQVMTAYREGVRQIIPYQLLVSLVGAVGGVGVLRLWLARTGTSVGDALVFALKMAPTMIAVQIIMAIAIALIALVLVMPGFAAGGGVGILLVFVGLLLFAGVTAYLWARLSTAAPVIADRALYNPVAALRQSWALTRDNGWRIFLFFFLIFVVILIVSAILGAISYAIFGSGEGIGRILSGLVEGGVAAVSGLVSLAITAAIYRQLSTRGNEGIFA